MSLSLTISRSGRIRAGVAAGLAAATAVGLALAHPAGAADPTVRLTKDVLSELATLVPLGATDPATSMQVAITLDRPDPAGEQAAYAAMYTPGSPSYHHFLTPAQFAERFGVPASTYDAVTNFATAHGLTVAQTSGSREFVLLEGSAAQVQRTFGIALKDFRQDGTSFYANVDAPSVPAGLGISGVIGLTNKLGMHTFHDAPAASAPHGVAPAQNTAQGTAQDSCLGDTCLGLTTPQDLWSIYDQPSTDYGEGQRMAIFGEGNTTPVISNLRAFEALHHLRRIPVHVVSAGDDGKDNTGEIEWDLDTQAASGMAPNAKELSLYFGKSLQDPAVLAVFQKWADDPNGPLQASASYGECEENPIADLTGNPNDFSASAMFTRGAEAALRKATMEGRTLFSSAGDTGSSCPVVPPLTLNGLTNEIVPIVSYPGSSPYVVSVGGTVLYGSKATPATRRLEYAWTFTGGGSSFVFAKPAYQDGIGGIVLPCLYNVAGVPPAFGKPCRGTPDVAAQSGDILTNGYGIVAGGSTSFSGGGTSLSSPLWLGMWTRVQATAPDGGLGFANESLYRAYKGSGGSADFFDVGGGAASLPVGNGVYLATPGWDYVSGLGVPDVTNLTRDLTGRLTPVHPALPPEPPVNATGSGTGVAPCQPLFTDFAGDDDFLLAGAGKTPQLDIVRGNLSLSPDGHSLRAVLTMRDLTTKTPTGAGASEYYLQWSVGGKTYFANAEVDLTGKVRYGDGTFADNVYTNANDDVGTLRLGPGGTVEIDVPLAHVGSPPVGTIFTAVTGSTKAEIGLPAVGGSLQPVDDAGPQHLYQLGAVCQG